MSSVFDNIKIEADKLNTLLNREDNEIEFKFGCSVYDLFEVLKELFKSLGLIKLEGEEDFSKFIFIHAYPDKIYQEENLITFEVVKRRPFIATSKAIKSNTTYTRPKFIKETFNPISGNIEDIYASVFNNTISLNVFSTKAKTTNNMARLIESIFFKYSSHIKKYIDEFVFIGVNNIQFTDKYDSKNRLFSRELQFTVITSEYFVLEKEQLKSIEISNTNNLI